jgi:hypothetical protein
LLSHLKVPRIRQKKIVPILLFKSTEGLISSSRKLENHISEVCRLVKREDFFLRKRDAKNSKKVSLQRRQQVQLQKVPVREKKPGKC